MILTGVAAGQARGGCQLITAIGDNVGGRGGIP